MKISISAVLFLLVATAFLHFGFRSVASEGVEEKEPLPAKYLECLRVQFNMGTSLVISCYKIAPLDKQEACSENFVQIIEKWVPNCKKKLEL